MDALKIDWFEMLELGLTLHKLLKCGKVKK